MTCDAERLQNSLGQTLLHRAVLRASLPTVESLVQCGAPRQCSQPVLPGSWPRPASLTQSILQSSVFTALRLKMHCKN